MTVKLLTEHHLEFLSFKGGCTGLSMSTLVEMPHCLKSHVVAQLWASTRENMFSGIANNKGADQPAHPRSLISTFCFAYWNVSYLELLGAKFQFSS